MATKTDVLTLIKNLNFNPIEITRIILSGIKSGGGTDLFNPTNPTLACIEAGILTPTAVLEEIKVITRALNPTTVDTWEDLYLHMQDEDLNDLTSQPSRATITMFMALDEIIRVAVAEDNSGSRVLRFPKHSQITVGGFTLMVVYPFVIRVNAFGSVSVKYDLNDGAGLGTITNALIAHEVATVRGNLILSFPIDVVQTAMTSKVVSISPSSGFKQKITISDNLFKIKAYTRFSNNSKWIPVNVTRRLRALDRSTPVFQFIEGIGQVTVQIPPFYLSNGMIGTEIRFDIFTTKGEFDQSLVNFNEDSYSMDYLDYDNKANRFPALFGALNIFKAVSGDTLTGGRARLSFAQAKSRTINRSSISEGIAITELELVNKLADFGLSITSIVDNINTRIYAASKLLPAPENGLTVTGIGCNVQTHQTTIEQLSQLPTARDNGDRITVLPTTLYEVVNGILNVVDAVTVSTIIDPALTTPEEVASWANSKNLVYSPYYYVHDVAANDYNVRPYRLDSPDVTNKVTVNENPSLQLEAAVFNYQILVKPDLSGYALYLGIGVGATFLERPIADISVQISYTDSSGQNRYYLTGVLDTPIDQETGRPLNDSYIYKFDIKTNWDIDRKHQLILSGTFAPIPLECEMDVFIIVRDYTPAGFSPTAMDSLINPFALNNYDGTSTQVALIQERLSVTLGTFMSNIWSRARTTIGDGDYKLYTDNIVKVYPSDEYQVDANGVIEMQPVNGVLTPIIKHRKGDAVVINGIPVYEHKINDIIYENGLPVYKNGIRGLTRQYDMVVLDGLYYLTTHKPSIDYLQVVLETIDDIVFNVLRDAISPELIGETKILYHPKSTVGLIQVYVENGIKTLVQSAQSLKLRVFVNGGVFQNNALKDSIKVTVKKVIQGIFDNNSTISVSDLTKAIVDNNSGNVLGVELSGFMNDDYSVVTVVDALTAPAIGKRLTVNSRLELVVEDDVDVEFVRHSVNI